MNAQARAEATAGRSKILEVLPLTALQTGMYLQSSLAAPESDPYLSQTVVTFRSAVDARIVTASITAMLDRYPHLKAVLRQRSNGTLVWVVPRATVPQISLSAAGADLEEARAVDRAAGFEFLRSPLIRFTVADRALVITYHHSLMDGWSEALFVRELLSVYEAGGTADRLEPAAEFGTFLGWMAKRDADAARTGWAGYLDGLDAPTLVASGTEVVESTPVRLDVVLPPDLGERVTLCAKDAGVTVNVVVQLAWALVLSSLTGRRDVVFGMAASIRPYDLPGAASIVGLLLNTVPVRVRVDRTVTTRDLLAHIQSGHLDLDDHRHLGLSDIARTAGHSTLFDTTVVYQNYPSAVPDDGASVDDVTVLGAPMSFPLALVAGPEPSLWAFVVYRPESIPADVASTVAKLFTDLLDELTADSDVPVSLALANARTSTEVHDTGQIVAVPRLEQQLAHRFAESAAEVAIVSGADTVTYAELATRVADLSAALRDAGTGPESTVAVAVPRGPDMVAALLAILDVGAAVVPIDIRYPRDRIEYLLADANPHTMIVDPDTSTLLSALVPATTRITTSEIPQDCGPAPFVSEWTGDLPAYLVYTSGSTGAPKGVLGTRDGLANRLHWAVNRWGQPRSRLAKSSLSFIDGTTELLTGLLAGQRVILALDDEFTDAYALARLATTHRAEQMTAVGSLAAALCDAAAADVATVTHWIVSGETLTSGVIESIAKACPATHLTNSYGSSEVVGDVATHDVSIPGNDSPAASVVGAAVPNTTIRVLDEFLLPVPRGVVGEIYVAGIQLARGYHRAPAATATRFVAYPDGAAGERMYRTGDRGRRLPDGTLDIVGRTDRQVKIRGHRIELGEIEAATAASGLVDDVAVIAVSDAAGRPRLAGFVVPSSGEAERGAEKSHVADTIGDEISVRLRQTLPEYMIPASWMVLAALPVTPNGKLDRLALARIEIPTTSTGGAAPQSATELALAVIIADLVGIDVAEIAAADDFFALGGDSIAAITFVRHAAREGIVLSTADVFARRTVAAIASCADAAVPRSAQPVGRGAAPLIELDDTERAELAASGTDIDDVRPATALQQGIVFQSLTAAEGSDEIYIIATQFEINGALESVRLEEALHALLDRHPSLRSTFTTLQSGRTVAVLRPHRDIEVRRYTVGSLDGPNSESLIAADRRTFDVEDSVLIRVTVLDESPVRHRVVLTMHHLLVDGWSVGTVGTDLFRLYQGRTLTAPASFDDYLRWLTSRESAAATTAWRKVLGRDPESPGNPVRPCLVSDSDGRASRVAAEEIIVDLSEARTGNLKSFAAQSGSTLSELVHAAWAVVLAAVTGQNDVVFGSTVSGRPADLDRSADMVGLFVNTVPVRVDVPAAATVSDVLGRLREQTVSVLDHHHVGLADIQRIGGVGRLFDTLVVFENFAEADTAGIDSADFTVRVGDFHTMTHYPITVTVFPGDRLRIVVEFRPDLVDTRSAAMMSDALHAVLASMHTPEAHRVSDLALVDAAERRRILGEFAGAESHYPGGTLVEVFDAQCVRTPELVAVTDARTTLTFSALDILANRIARALLRLGVGAEDVVVVPATRSALTLASIVAVMRSGAAYLPIEPDAPASRTQRIVDSARPTAIVTTPDDRAVDNALLDGSVTLGACMIVDTSTLAESEDDHRVVTDAERRTPLHADSPAYLIYTSGTTGVPKGVVVPHRGLANLYFSHRDRVHDPTVARTGRSHLNVGHAWSLAFDASWQPQLWMFGGHAVHVFDRDAAADPTALLRELRRVSADFVEVVPSVLEHLIRAGLGSEISALGVGGEAVTRELWDRMRSLDSVVLHNFYGPTEVTVDAVHTSTECSGEPLIGRPVAGLRAYVLDAGLRPVPVGVVGELYLGGPGVVRGYRAAPALTAQHFLPDPFAADGTRMYRTGDLVSWTDHGLLDYTGRADHQVKIRGHRVELGEIEHCLRALDGVADARVVARTDGTGTERLSAHVVPEPRRTLDIGELRAGVAGRLPSYMVPASYTVLDRFPLLSNGKLDLAAFPEGKVPDRVPSPPETDLEHRLCAEISDLLGIPDIGVDDDFFDLGGDSIMSMELSARLRARGLTVSPRDVSTGRTVRALAVSAEASVGAQVDSRYSSLSPYGEVPLTPIVAWLAGVDGPIDQISQAVLLRIPAEFTEQRIVAMIDALARRHPILRARFDGTQLDIPEPDGFPSEWLSVLDITGERDDSAREAVRAESRAAKARLRPADGRMIDLVWFRRDEEPGELLITLHHLVVDGVSWRVLLPDLHVDGYGSSTTPVAEPAPDSFRRWAHAVHDHAHSASILDDLDRWAAIAAPGARIPLIRPLDPTADVGATLDRVSFTLTEDETAALLAGVSTVLGGSVDDVLLGTFTAALAAWSEAGTEGADAEFVVDVEGHGRGDVGKSSVDGSGVVGWLTDVHPIRITARTDRFDAVLTGSVAAARELVAGAKRARSAVPGEGMSYGALRYLNPQGRKVLGEYDSAAVEFNFLGRFDLGGDDGGDDDGGRFRASPLRDSMDSGLGDAVPCSHPVVVDGYVHDRRGVGGLTTSMLGATVAWPPAVVAEVPRLVDAWAAALRSVAAIVSGGDGG
ncbi:amino acid adenylation domain-containing protein [Rhodococcus sp. NPDC056506]|uniref:amino acid adenylation domain-containing protein n=1 Tax=Rhodococcus sp. NPDC056506 TaxID=3345844 RepID=UPI00366FFD6E